MKKGLGDSCHELGEVLSRVKERCEAILADLHRFDSYVASYAVDRLVRRLAILNVWVSGVAESLYRDHRRLGYVAVLLSEGSGITIHWVEREKIVANKASYRSDGYTVLSVEEMVDIIDELARELDSGNWAKVVEWVNRYGRSPGLEFDRFPETHTTGDT